MSFIQILNENFSIMMTLHKTPQYVQHDWPQMMKYITGGHNNYEYMDEYICIQCSTSLQCSKPKMPDQACANNLKLR